MVKTEVAARATPVTEAPADVYRQLREAIVSGEFQPNERLVEVDLARRLKTGRTSIRAALVRLDQAAELVSFAGSPATEPLYTINPFLEVGLAALFVTHPRVGERVRRLRELDPDWREKLRAA